MDLIELHENDMSSLILNNSFEIIKCKNCEINIDYCRNRNDKCYIKYIESLLIEAVKLMIKNYKSKKSPYKNFIERVYNKPIENIIDQL